MDMSGTKLRQLFRMLIERAETHYTCLRGPRPSGALFIPTLVDANKIYYDGIPGAFGDVKPAEDSVSCKEHGTCMIEDGHCVRNIHAEVDALLTCAKHGIPTYDGVMLSINKPCFNCTKACIKAGIKTIYYAYAVYDEQRTKDILSNAGVKCIHVEL